MKSPSGNLLLFTVKARAEKSGLPTRAAINGVIRSLTSAANHRSEGSAHYYRYRQVDDISPHQELLEAFQTFLRSPREAMMPDQRPACKNFCSRSMAGSRMERSAA